VPSYRVFRKDAAGNETPVGGIVWGQDETNVVEDLIAGWDGESSSVLAETGKARFEVAKAAPRL